MYSFGFERSGVVSNSFVKLFVAKAKAFSRCRDEEFLLVNFGRLLTDTAQAVHPVLFDSLDESVVSFQWGAGIAEVRSAITLVSFVK